MINNKIPSVTIWLLALFVFSFVAWSSFMEIEQVVRAEGRVIPSGQNKQIQHLEGGIVSEILVAEGDIVNINQPLFRISNSSAKAQLQTLDIEKIALEARIVRIKVQLANKKEIHFPKYIEEKSPEMVSNELKLMHSQQRNFENQQRVLKDSVGHKQLKLEEERIRVQNLNRELKFAQEDYELIKQLEKSGAVSKREILSTKQRIQAIRTRLEASQATIPSAKAEINEAKSRYSQNISNYQLKLQEELNTDQLDLDKILEQQKAGAERQSREEILSPVNGIVNQLFINTQGGIIKPGDSLADITPLDDTLIIEAKIKAKDRADVWLGQEVKAKVSAYDFAVFGSLDGIIIALSPDSSNDNRGEFFYTAKIKVNKTNFGPSNPIIPGMLSQVDILTGKKTILNYLINPIRRGWQNALQEG